MILKDVTATISTRGRSNTTLPLVLLTLLNQNSKPGKVIVYDDNESFDDPRKNDVLNNILAAMLLENIEWVWLPGAKAGQVTNHENARTTCTTPYLWRIDDDNTLLPNTLEVLYKTITSDSKIGAVSPSIIDPKAPIGESKLDSNKMEDIFLGLNEQWVLKNNLEFKEVEHLQGSTFLYKVEAAKHGYETRLSKKGHREETIFTHEMFRAGWKLIAVLGLKTWHFHYQTGGIRSEKDNNMAQSDEYIFRNKLAEWKTVTNKYRFYYLDSGRGDHYAFKSVLLEIIKKFKDYKIIVACCWPDCFWDIKGDNIIYCSLSEGAPFVNRDAHNVYKYMLDNNWNRNVTEAYKKIYL